MKKSFKKIIKSLYIFSLVVILVILPLSASKCNTAVNFSDFHAQWNYSEDEIQIELTTVDDMTFPQGTLTLDGVTTDIVVYVHDIDFDDYVIIFDAKKVDIEGRRFRDNYDARIFIARISGYKNNVKFEVIYDYTGRVGEKSLLRKEFVLTRTDLE